MSLLRVPDLGEGLTEVQIVVWHVVVGDHVVTDQPVVSVETDKAVVEIPAPGPGTVARTWGEPGDVVAVGAPLVEFGDAGAPDAGAVVGSLPSAAARAPGGSTAATVDASPTAAATPAVRRRAAELGVDLATVSGTGPGGTPTRADVEAAAHGKAPAGSPPVEPPPAEPLRGVRRAMAANMTRAGAVVVPATVTDDADVSTWAGDEEVTVRLVRAVAAGCAAEPRLNAWFLGIDEGLVVWDAVHLGIAVDAPDGLFVPVLRDAALHPAAEIRDRVAALRAAVRDRSVTPDALRGATITLSNFGSLAGRHGALVVVPPQVAIVGAGRLRDEVLVHDGRPSVGRVLPLSLTFDHRVVTGGEATRFLDAVITDLQRPSALEETQ